MRYGNRNTASSVARGVCVTCLVASLAACSGGKKPTLSSTTAAPTTTKTTAPPPTTLPSATSIATVKTWFAAHGAPLVAFERATDALATGKVPTAAACLKYFKTDLPHITKDQNTLVRLTQAIPNPTLASVMRADVAQKLLVGAGCGLAVVRNRPIPVGVPGAYSSVRTLSVNAHLWLSRFGISV